MSNPQPVLPENVEKRFNEASQGMFELMSEQYPSAAPAFKNNMKLFLAQELTRLESEKVQAIQKAVIKTMKLVGCEFVNESWYDDEGVEGTTIRLPDGKEIQVLGWGSEIDVADIFEALTPEQKQGEVEA